MAGPAAFGLIASILDAIYSVGATVYVPHLFSSYASRYGVIGAVFAMISALFCVMVVLVGSAALGREVSDELDRIRRGERPPDRDVRRQWDNLLERDAIALECRPRANRPSPLPQAARANPGCKRPANASSGSSRAAAAPLERG